MTRKEPIGDFDRSAEGAGRTALITGASSGIGKVIATLLAAKGYDILPLARREDRLVELCNDLSTEYGVMATPVVADLADPETPRRVVTRLEEAGIRVDFLVNNAGYAKLGRYDTHEWDDHLARVRVMGLATLEFTHRLLPPMIENQWGRVINVSSIAGTFEATPQDVLYAATKSMVTKFTEGLAIELRGTGVNLTASLPGFTDTEIFVVSEFADHVNNNPAMRMAMMTPATVVRQAYKAVMAGRPLVIHGIHHKAIGAVMLHAPRPARRWLSDVLAGRIDFD